MSSWIKTLSFFLLLSFRTQACDFRPEIQKVFSLSGPVTTAFKELGLLNHPKLKGISVFYPASPQEFTGMVIPGGIFLSPETKKVFAGSTLYFDQSRELKKLFSSSIGVNPIEVISRNLVPREVSQEVIKLLKPVLTGCELKLQAYLLKTYSLEEKLLSKIIKPLPVVFFVGEFVHGRLPEMVMANDGVVKWLRLKNKLETYPSELNYVNWSARIMNSLPKSTYRVAIKDAGRNSIASFKQHSPSEISVIYPGGLIPGINQLQSWIYWLEQLQR